MWITLFPNAAAAHNVHAGKLFTVRIAGAPVRICLTRSADGELRAFADECPHKRVAFSRGGSFSATGDVICPMHGYHFELNTGRETTGETCPPLRTYTFREAEDGAIQIFVPGVHV